MRREVERHLPQRHKATSKCLTLEESNAESKVSIEAKPNTVTAVIAQANSRAIISTRFRYRTSQPKYTDKSSCNNKRRAPRLPRWEKKRRVVKSSCLYVNFQVF